jgi:hypothetical protein
MFMQKVMLISVLPEPTQSVVTGLGLGFELGQMEDDEAE